MNVKVIRLYYAVLFLGLVLCLIAVLLNKDFSIDRLMHEEVIILNDSTNKVETDNEVSYEFQLPKGNNSGKSIAFYSSHFKSRIFINNQEVYSYNGPYGNIFKSAGYKWNYFFLDNAYSGANVKVFCDKVYSNSFDEPSIFLGPYNLIITRVIHEGFISFIVAIMILCIGFILLLYSIFVVNEHISDSTLIYFSFFAMLLGLWSLADSHISPIIWNAPIVFMFITHLSLMIMPAAFIMFIHNSYHDKNHFHWGVFCNISNVIALARMLLQLTGVKDFKNTLWMTHLSIVALVIICIYMSIREIISIKMTKQMWINILSVLLIMGTTFLDLLHYELKHSSSSFGSVGFLLYIILMGLQTIKMSRKMMARTREAEVYRKLAFTDELTGLFNRTAFQRDLENQENANHKSGKSNIALIMLDLNDLKKCNDTFGHNYGDEYISMVSIAIHEVFSLDGRCYRIGGDEFSVILPYISENDITNRFDAFNRKISALNNKKFVVPISVASGYAVYNDKEDANLNDTLSRADKLMYENKQFLKNSKAK